MDTPYFDPIVKRYRDLILSKFGDGFFKGVYQGDPIRIPMSMLPALVIAKSESRISVRDSVNDRHEVALVFTVVSDIRTEIRDEKELVPGISALYDIIEGRNEDTLQLKSNSLLGVLRGNTLVDAANGLRTNLGSETRVNYALTVGKRQEDAWAVEAQVELVADFTQVR